MMQIISRRCPRCGIAVTVRLSDLKISSALARLVIAKTMQGHIADYHAGRNPAWRGLLRLIRGNK